MSWNITDHPQYAIDLKKVNNMRMGNLKKRTDELNILRYTKKDVVAEFSAQIPFWLHHGKGLDRIEDFLTFLCEAGRFEDHKGCLEVWSEALHADPMRLYENFFFKNYNLALEKTPNETIRANDSFELINGLLALDPVRCLKIPGILSGNWMAGALEPEKRDLAMLAIFSGFSRYITFHEKHSHRDGYKTGVEERGIQMFQEMSRSMGESWGDFIAKMPESPAKMTPHLQRYYSKLVGAMQSYAHSRLPLPYLLKHTDSQAPRQLFDIGLKTKLLGTPQHAKYLDSVSPYNDSTRYSNQAEQNHYARMIDNPYTDLKQIRNVISPYSLESFHINMMEEYGFAKEYIKLLKPDEREHLILKGVIASRLLDKLTDRAIKFTDDLGM